MSDPAASALCVVLFGMSALFVFAAAGKWLHLGKDRERPDERPVIPVHSFRSAANLTAVALGLVGASLLLAAGLALP